MRTTTTSNARTAVATVATLLAIALILWPKAWLPAREESPKLLPHADKLVHGGLFATCTLLWMVAGGRRLAPVVLAIGLLLAVSTEYLQGLPVINRDPDSLDGLADVAGLFAAVGLWWAFRARSDAVDRPRVLPATGPEP